MRRGTTPTIYFKLPFELDLVDELWLTIEQRDKEIITKTKADVTPDGDRYIIKLTQEETLNLDDGIEAKAQLRIRTTAGEALASSIKRLNVEEILKDGVI